MTSTLRMRTRGSGGSDLSELQDRVWEQSYRNLRWMIRHNGSLLRHWQSLRIAKRRSLEESSSDELAVMRCGGGMDEVMQRCMTVSALSLRPQLDELLANYGTELVDPPSLEEARKKSKIAASKVKDVLPFVASKPGEAFVPPQVVWTFTIDEWPITQSLAEFRPVDPKTRRVAAWVCTGQANLPNVLNGLPEIEIDADYSGIMAHTFGIGWDLLEKPFNFLTVPNATIQTGVHSNASVREIDEFFRGRGVKTLNAKEALKIQGSFSRVEDGNRGWLEEDPPGAMAQEWLDEAWIAPAERSGLFEKTQLWRLGETTLDDRLGALLERLPDDIDLVDLYVEIFTKMDARWKIETPIWWRLAQVLRSRVDVQKALTSRGFDEGARQLFHRRVALAGTRRGIRAAPAEISVADLALPAGVGSDVAKLLRARFPMVTDAYVIRLKRVFEESGALMATFEALFSNPTALQEEDGYWGDLESSSGPEPKTGVLLGRRERGDATILETALDRLGQMSAEEMKACSGLFLLRPAASQNTGRRRAGR